MDLHKPKPWHSFREFLKEYLIIVVRVLTALAGEQAGRRRFSAAANRSAWSPLPAHCQRIVKLVS
jgi:hypothetical protein